MLERQPVDARVVAERRELGHGPDEPGGQQEDGREEEHEPAAAAQLSSSCRIFALMSVFSFSNTAAGVPAGTNSAIQVDSSPSP